MILSRNMRWLDGERSKHLGEQISVELQLQQLEKAKKNAQIALRQSVFPALAHDFKTTKAEELHPGILTFQALGDNIGTEYYELEPLEETYALATASFPVLPDTENAAFIEINWRDTTRPVVIGGGYIGGFGRRVAQSKFTPLNIVLLLAKPNGDLFVVNKGKFPWSKPEMRQLPDPQDREKAEQMLEYAVRHPIKSHLAIPVL